MLEVQIKLSGLPNSFSSLQEMSVSFAETNLTLCTLLSEISNLIAGSQYNSLDGKTAVNNTLESGQIQKTIETEKFLTRHESQRMCFGSNTP